VPQRRAGRLPVTLRRSLTLRLASARTIPVSVALIVLVASFISFQPGAQPVGAAQGPGTTPRIAIGGMGGMMEVDGAVGGSVDGEEYKAFDDATLYKPVAVDTSVSDASRLLKSYVVQQGDTLTAIASRFGVSMMTIWWANDLKAKDDLHVGQKLVIPPVSGLVVTVAEGDTLESLAAKYKIDTQSIVEVNDLQEPTLVIGQKLILPDAVGAPIATPPPTPKPAAKPVPKKTTGGSVTYTGGSWAWPVRGHYYISQYFHYGHWAIDIASDYGNPVVAARNGKVVFAGWKNNGGGWQVWLSMGNGMYTGYYHMSALLTAGGRSVSKGQQIGRIGQSGHATGPHLHFEVWVGGMIWDGGTRVNPLKYY
jgi:murein DD-endopeptidase MepM/ murein hydrolase activator NlpD